jgi:hypothetical protein
VVALLLFGIGLLLGFLFVEDLLVTGSGKALPPYRTVLQQLKVTQVLPPEP